MQPGAAPLLKADNLVLRPLAARDAAALGLEPAVAEALLAEVQQGGSLLWLLAPNPRQPGPRPVGLGWIGLRGLSAPHRRALLDGLVLPAQRRQGHMLAAARRVLDYAFQDLRLHRIGAQLDPENAAAQALLARLDFAAEGRLRGYRSGPDGQPASESGMIYATHGQQAVIASHGGNNDR